MRISTMIAMSVLVSTAAHAEPASWTIINGKSDPLTKKPSRYAVAMPKSAPVFHGQPVTSALIIRCATIFLNKPSEPELMILFTGLTGAERVKRMQTRYRWDEGPVRSYMLKSSGAHGTRAIELPKFTSASNLVPAEDPLAGAGTPKR